MVFFSNLVVDGASFLGHVKYTTRDHGAAGSARNNSQLLDDNRSVDELRRAYKGHRAILRDG